MRRYGFLLLCTLALAALTTAVAATVASAHSTPQIRAEQAHERAVLAEVNQIGVKLQAAQDARWNAIQQLKLVKQSLHQNEYRLHVARGNLHAAQQRLMSRLYSLYVNGSPSTIEVLAGAHSLSQVIDRAESAQGALEPGRGTGNAGAPLRARGAGAGAAAEAAQAEARAGRRRGGTRRHRRSQPSSDSRSVCSPRSIRRSRSSLRKRQHESGRQRRQRRHACEAEIAARQAAAAAAAAAGAAVDLQSGRSRRRRRSTSRSEVPAPAMPRQLRSPSSTSASRTSGAARARAGSTAQAS